MYAHNSNDVVKYEDDGYKMKTIDVIRTNGTQMCVNGAKGYIQEHKTKHKFGVWKFCYCMNGQ